MTTLRRTRPGTLDQSIASGVAGEYPLPERFGRRDVVIDIGVHIGGFCLEAVRRGARRVFGFEAERSNYLCAAENLRQHAECVNLTHAAVWRSDRPAGSLTFFHSWDRANTGGGGIIFWRDDVARAEAVPCLPFDDVLRDATSNGRRRVRLLKIDCEGSEFPILLTSKRLHLVDEIVGEYHEVGGEFDDHALPEDARLAGVDRFTMASLAEFLGRQGFAVESRRNGQTHLGLFRARRIEPAGLWDRLRRWAGR